MPNQDLPAKNDRYLLYIDILGFSDLVTADSPKVHDLYEVIASLNVHKHSSFRAIVFSDTILVYNAYRPTTAYDRRYLVMYLCEFAQDLQDRLTRRGIVFRAVLVRGDFMHYELNSVPCFFGTALIDAYRSEKQIQAIGLFMEHSLIHDCDIFQIAPFNDRYDFVFITQTLDTIEVEHGVMFPIDRFSLEQTDLIYSLVPEVLHLKQLSDWATAHKDERVRQKCVNTLALFRAQYPDTLNSLEATGFELEAISPGAKWIAGTSFHELWALSQAMKLLDLSSGISAVAVEGLGQKVKASGDVTEFDGVDCTVLYGSADLATADRVDVIQLKYSGSRPSEKWTLSRLTNSSKKTGDNSVLRRLATAYEGVRKIAKAAPRVRLISNQAVSNDVLKGFQGLREGDASGFKFRTKVLKATSLDASELKAFAKSLDLISSTGSRFQLEEELLLEISRWTDDDARATLDVLLSFIHKQMLPENAKRFMIRENVLIMIAGSSSPDSLFPCPNETVSPRTPVLRAAAKDLAAKLTGGAKQVCLHGGPGCGAFQPVNNDAAVFQVDII